MRYLTIPVTVLLLAIAPLGCGSSEEGVESAHVQQARQAIDDRIIAAMRAGLEQARARQVPDLPADSELPTTARLDDGSLHPLVQRWAFDGDGNLRGEGPSMQALEADLRQALANE